MHVTNSFTQSEIDFNMYVDPLKGYDQNDARGDVYVPQSTKAVFGTKQAFRLW